MTSMQQPKNSSAEQMRQKVAIAETAAKDERLTPETRDRNRIAAMMGRKALELMEQRGL